MFSLRDKRWVIAGACGVVVLALVATRLWRRARSRPDMRAVQVERRDLAVTRTATGEVKPRNRVEVKPPIAGRIEEVLVREGDHVTSGQVLVWMSSSERAALLDAARAQGAESVARWETVYKPAPLIAPLEGTVIVRAAEPGQTIQTSDPVVVIADHLIVKAQVDETDVGYLKVGQQAEITLDAYPQELIAGEVEHVAYEAQLVNNVTIYEVDVRPAQVPDFMRSGMTANVSIVVAEARGALVVPTDAVRQDSGAASVLVRAGAFGRTARRPVEVGLTDGKWMEIKSGLEEGQAVLVSALRLPKSSQKRSPLTPGQRRRPSG